MFQLNDTLSLRQILSSSNLTKTQTFVTLDALIESKQLVRDEIKNIYYK